MILVSAVCRPAGHKRMKRVGDQLTGLVCLVSLPRKWKFVLKFGWFIRKFIFGENIIMEKTVQTKVLTKNKRSCPPSG